MYWCKPRLKIVIALIGSIILTICGSACKSDIKERGALKYFDLKGYFKNDSIRLTKENRMVFKTVTHNGVSQSKTVHISDWGLELDLFKEADINKPAWKDSYTVIDEDSVLIYRAKYPKLMKVSEILIKKDKGKVKWILIYSKTPENRWIGLKIPPLYITTEKLTYFPDSLYLIVKSQWVRFIGANVYRIQGVIKK